MIYLGILKIVGGGKESPWSFEKQYQDNNAARRQESVFYGKQHSAATSLCES